MQCTDLKHDGVCAEIIVQDIKFAAQRLIQMIEHAANEHGIETEITLVPMYTSDPGKIPAQVVNLRVRKVL